MEKIENQRLLDLDLFMRTLQSTYSAGLRVNRDTPSSQRRDKQSKEKSRPHLREASLLRRRLVMKVLSEKIENVFEAKNVFRRCFTERFVRCKHRFGPGPFFGRVLVVFR